MAETGYTLPVFAVAAAKSALLHLLEAPSLSLSSERPTVPLTVDLDLLPDGAKIPIQHVARLDAQSALAITLSDPGDNLDLTRNTPIWAWVQLSTRQTSPLVLIGGEGVGQTAEGKAAIYHFARQLFDANLLPLIPAHQTATVTIVLPEGRQLAQRTSNAAFGVLEGLSLLGTSGISQPHSVADHLDTIRQTLQDTLQHQPDVVFCIGSNGRQVAQRLGIPEGAIAQTGNWLGAMLVAAGLYQARSVLLLGYHGKLVKLAGGIFNTSSHLADAKLEIISAAVVAVGGDLAAVRAVLASGTADAAHKQLITLGLADAVFAKLAGTISHKAMAYVQKYADVSLPVGTILFDRQGQILGQDGPATSLLRQLIGG